MMNKMIALTLMGIFMVGLIPVNANTLNLRSNSVVHEIGELDTKDYTKLKTDSSELAKAWGDAKRQLHVTKATSTDDVPIFKPNTTDEDNTDRLNVYKDFLNLTIDRIINRLMILSFWVDRVIDDEDVKKELIAQIKEDVDDFEQLRKSINDAQSVSELRDLSKNIKEKWKNAHLNIKKMVGHILGVRYGNMIERYEKVSDDLHKKIDGLNQSNSLVIDMQDLLDKFDKEIELAIDEFETYKQHFITISNGNPNVLESREDLKSVHKHLKNAHSILKDIIRLYREYQKSLTPDNSTRPPYLKPSGGGKLPEYTDINPTGS